MLGTIIMFLVIQGSSIYAIWCVNLEVCISVTEIQTNAE